jgi:Skp family chaperone for outer membrane proteins
MTRNVLAAATGLAALALASTALAQQAPAAAPAITHGPPLANVCILSVEGAIGTSTVGKYVESRMGQIVAQVNAELNAEKTAIDTEAKSLDAQRSSLDQSTLERRASDLQVRANALQRKAEMRDREVQATEQKALARVGQELDPLLRAVYQQKQCSILLHRNAILMANPAMDITPQVVTALNAKITQFSFDRERLEQGAAPAAAAPAARK